MSKKVDSLIEELFRDLEISNDNFAEGIFNKEIAFVENLADSTLRRVGMDLAFLAASSGDWESSVEIVERLMRLGSASFVTKLWRLRCLVELERYAEALALSRAYKWPTNLSIHVNYLTGLSYRGLGLEKNAQNFFQKVVRQDSDYREVDRLLIPD